MKSERAEDYLINHECGYPMDGYVPLMEAGRAVEIAEQDAEERTREELTRWHDPKEKLPEGNMNVIIRYLADKEGICTGCYNSNKERWELNDIYLSHLSDKVPIHVLAWREILE